MSEALTVLAAVGILIGCYVIVHELVVTVAKLIKLTRQRRTPRT